MQTLPATFPVNRDIFQSPDSRWLALTHRNPSSHSSFLYGVKSTKIYCRPTCPARLARRANVVFYDTEDQARQDGFRPCRRCQPDNPYFVGEKEEIVTRVLVFMHEKDGGPAIKRNIKELAKEVGVTPGYLCRIFKKTMGMTLGEYMEEFERDPSEGLLERSQISSGFSGSVMFDPEAGFRTTSMSPAPPGLLPVEAGLVGDRNLSGWLTEQDSLVADDPLRLDLNVGECIFINDFLNDSIFRQCA